MTVYLFSLLIFSPTALAFIHLKGMLVHGMALNSWFMAWL